MKRVGNLFDKIVDIDNLILADKKARKGKYKSKEIKKFDLNKDEKLLELQNNLINNNFKTSNYKTFKLNEYGKERLVYKLPYYPDRIVHHAIMNVLEPIWTNLLIRDTFSCIKGRGIHDGLIRLTDVLNNNIEETKYCLKFDIKKYYPSIDNKILKNIIRKKIKDKQVLLLLDEIIDSTEGIPIGNYLSQIFANLYLSYFDHWCKENKKIKYYFRYADDVVILHEDKIFLNNLFKEIEGYLKDNLKLTIKENYQIFPVEDRGIDFLGYKSFHKYKILRKSIKKRMFKKLKIIKNINNFNKTFASYNGWLVHCNSFNLKNKIIRQTMKKFSDLNIKLDNENIFMSEKMKISEIVEKQIIVESFKITDSKFPNKKCLNLYFNFNNKNKITFSSSEKLIEQIEKVNINDFPFETKIIKLDFGGYIFT